MNRTGVAAALLAVVLPATAGAAPPEPLRSRQWGLDRIQADTAWARAVGAGVAVAIVDTGVDLLHEDLRPRLIGGHDFVDGDEQAQDVNGHGTHVAGIVAASAGNRIGGSGAAPGAAIMPLRVLDSSGAGSESSVIDAIDFAVEHSRRLGLRLVVNLSLTDVTVRLTGAPVRLQAAIRRAWTAGAVIVAAAGNESLPFGEYPASGPNVISVGAIDQSGNRASFSNQGALVVAPGDRIVSTWWDAGSPNEHGAYAIGAGTSMAAPFVSAVAALLLSTGLTNAQVVARIVETADDVGPPGRDADFGFGVVNAARAVGLAAVPPPRLAAASAPQASPGSFEQIAGPPDARAERRGSGRTLPIVLGAGLLGVALLVVRVRRVPS